MAEETHRSAAAEIPVTSNGDLDDIAETVFQRVKACLKAYQTRPRFILMVILEACGAGYPVLR